MFTLTHQHPLRKLHPVLDTGTAGDAVFDRDLANANLWNAYITPLRARRKALQEELDALDVANEKAVLEPLRRAAEAALAQHIAASAALEAARVQCGQQGRELRNRIDALAHEVATPMYPEVDDWKAAPVQLDVREAAAAALTPMQSGADWINPNKIHPGMPIDFGPQSQIW